MLVLSEYRKKSVTLKTVSQILNNEQPLLCVSLKSPQKRWEMAGNGRNNCGKWQRREFYFLFFYLFFIFYTYVTLEWEEEDLNKIANRKFYFAFSQIFSVFDVF